MPSAPQGVEYVAPLLALITIAISIPLVLCKVPPNVIYGVRTRKTLSDPRIWYEANYRGGMALIVAGMVALVCWAVLLMVLDRSTAAVASLFTCIAAMVVATVVCLVQVRNRQPASLPRLGSLQGAIFQDSRRRMSDHA